MDRVGTEHALQGCRPGARQTDDHNRRTKIHVPKLRMVAHCLVREQASSQSGQDHPGLHLAPPLRKIGLLVEAGQENTEPLFVLRVPKIVGFCQRHRDLTQKRFACDKTLSGRKNLRNPRENGPCRPVPRMIWRRLAQ